MLNCLKRISQSVVQFLGLSSSYIVVSYLLMPIIEPYIIEGWLGFVQIFGIGFCIGFGGTAIIFYIKDNVCINYLQE